VARCHGPDKFTHSSAIFDLHRGFESGLFFRVVRSDGRIELLKQVLSLGRGVGRFSDSGTC
jgi:hypothetical protein